jgi:hypothetical protein
VFFPSRLVYLEVQRMTAVGKTFIPLLKPRYNFAHLVAVTAVVAAVALCSAKIKEREMLSAFQEMYLALFQSPLADVRVDDHDRTSISEAYQRQYDFTDDMFTRCIPVWKQVLAPFKGKPGVQYLEIGLYEGGSAVWMLENVLTHPTARLTGIDIFEGPVKDRFLANIELSGSADKVTTTTGYSQLALRELPFDSFDIVYVDGSHDKDDVLEDAILCWRLVKEDGLLIFDDYRGANDYVYDGIDDIEPGSSWQSPKPAIDPFVQCFDEHFEVIHNGFQLILRKKSRTAES